MENLLPTSAEGLTVQNRRLGHQVRWIYQARGGHSKRTSRPSPKQVVTWFDYTHMADGLLFAGGPFVCYLDFLTYRGMVYHTQSRGD